MDFALRNDLHLLERILEIGLAILTIDERPKRKVTKSFLLAGGEQFINYILIELANHEEDENR